MGFLNPLWLLLGAAVAIPLIIHLLQRHQGPRVVFPAVRYLKRAEREHARRIKLRQLILLLLRVAAVLFIAFAAARPFLRGAGSGHEPSAVVIVLDNSLSSGYVTGDRRVLDELKDRALETIERAGPDDRFWLLRAGSPWEPALPGDAATTARRIRETQPSAGTADLIAAVTRARAILAQGAEGRAREIEVLSDLQATNVVGNLDTPKNHEPAVLLWAPERKNEPNAAVDNIVLGGGLAPRAGERSNIVADISGNAHDSISVRLTVDGRIAGVAITQPGAAAIIPFPARNASLVTGDVQIDADALRADDRRYFVATLFPPPRVLLTQATPFVSEGLDVLADAGRIARTTNTPDVVIAPGGFSSDAAGANGSVIVLPPESPLELPALNRRLVSLGINWRYEQRPATGELQFERAGTGDELLRGLAGARVLQSYRLTPVGTAHNDSVMLRLSDHSAWAVRGHRARGGKFVLLASPLTLQATTLPASPAMIPLLDRATGVWSAPDAPRAEVQPGERVALPPSTDEVIDPDGNHIKVAGRASFDEATQPGVYRVVTNGRVGGAFVVNGARVESDLRFADPKRVERALAPLNVKRVKDAGGWQHGVYTNRVGREVWRFLLFVLLVLLIVEAFAARTGNSPGTAASTRTTPAPARALGGE